MKRIFLVVLMGCSGTALAQVAPRGGSSEWGMHLHGIVGSTRYTFEGGAAAQNDGGAGIGIWVARNLNNHFAVGLEATLAEFNYRASVAPGSGNAGSGFDTRGDMESGTLRANFTWNLLSRPLTPFLSAAAGIIYLDPDLSGDPPANACWVYPWYGQVCGDKVPRNALTRLSYGAGGGLRYDLPRQEGFVRAYVGGEWIEFSEALSTVGYLTIRADFGLRF
jgi:hypothetical protein